jgi:hypothetical protein
MASESAQTRRDFAASMLRQAANEVSYGKLSKVQALVDAALKLIAADVRMEGDSDGK